MNQSVQEEFRVEVDQIDQREWHELIQQFDDANFYQTWSHAARKWGEQNLSHLVLKRNDVVVAAVQMTVLKISFLPAGIAHTRFGPMWLKRSAAQDPEVYRRILRAMHREYVEGRRLVLRIKPWESEVEASAWLSTKQAQGYHMKPRIPPYNTLVLDLTYSLDEIHRGLARKWRRDLKKAQKHGMLVEASQSVEALATFRALYNEMYRRKGFVDSTDIDLLADVCRDLPNQLKPWTMVCTHEGEPVAAIVFSQVGNRTLALFGATSPDGLKLGASYVVNWAVVSWLKDDGRCRWYDLVGGLGTAGIRHFKAGLAKGCGKELNMHDFDAASGFLSRAVVTTASMLRPVWVWARTSLRRYFHARD